MPRLGTSSLVSPALSIARTALLGKLPCRHLHVEPLARADLVAPVTVTESATVTNATPQFSLLYADSTQELRRS